GKVVNGESGKMAARSGKEDSSAKRAASTKGAPEAVRSEPSAAEKATKKVAAKGRGLGFERRFTTKGIDPLDQVTWERRSSVITNPDGSVVFKMEGAEIPST